MLLKGPLFLWYAHPNDCNLTPSIGGWEKIKNKTP